MTDPVELITTNYHILEHENLTFKSLIALTLLLIYIIGGSIFSKLNIYYIHESGVCMILGMIISTIAYFFTPLNFSKSLNFDDGIFFTFILPPIIFGAGYNMKTKNFFKYFHYSILFGIIGTFISFSLICSITYFFNNLNCFKVNFSFKDILLFSSVITATDTISPLAFINEETQNKLFGVLFGEGIMNDSFTIVIYQIITKFYGILSNWSILTYFLFLYLTSCFVGIIIGALCSLFLKFLKRFKLIRTQEISVILIFGFFSYIIAELLNLSAIISLLFCSITLSNYAFYNLSFIAREESCIVVKIMSNIAEGFVFTYLGLSFFNMSIGNYSIIFILIEFTTIILSRFIAIYSLSFIINLFTDNPLISKEQKVISIAGCIRGAIAFGLALSLETGNPINNSILLSTTLILVFSTTIIFGAMVPSLTQNLSNIIYMNYNNLNVKLLDNDDNKSLGDSYKSIFKYDHPNNEILDEDENNLNGFSKVWFNFDNYVLKPILVGNWEKVKKRHNELSNKIKETINN